MRNASFSNKDTKGMRSIAKEISMNKEMLRVLKRNP